MTNWHYSGSQTTGPNYNIEIDSKGPLTVKHQKKGHKLQLLISFY